MSDITRIEETLDELDFQGLKDQERIDFEKLQQAALRQKEDVNVSLAEVETDITAAEARLTALENLPVEVVGGSTTNERIYRKYFTGTTAAAATTTFAHGVAAVTDILSVDAAILSSGTGFYHVHDFVSAATAAEAYNLLYDATNIQFGTVGANLQGQAFVVRIDYKV